MQIAERKYPFNPQTTAFTNYMLDEIMPTVSGNAWKVLCLAMRKTEGWRDADTYSGRKESDVISISQFMDGCGIGSHNTVQSAIDECIQKGYLLREKEEQSFRYRLNRNYFKITMSEIDIADMGTMSKIDIVTMSEIDNTNNKINNKEHGESSKNELSRKQAILEGNRLALEKGLQRQGNGGSFFTKLPEGLRNLARVFLDAWNKDYEPPKPEFGLWIKELREWQRIGVTDDIITQTVSKMRNQNLTIKSPRSITGMLLDAVSKSAQGQMDLPPVFHATEEQQKAYQEKYG